MVCSFCVVLPIRLFDYSEPGNSTPVSFGGITCPSFPGQGIWVALKLHSGVIDLAGQDAVSTGSCDGFNDGHVTPSRSMGAYSRKFSRTTGGKKGYSLSAGATGLVEYYPQVWT